MHGSVHKVAEVAVVEATVAVIEKVASHVVATNATSATNLDTLHENVKRIKTFAIVAKVLGILQKTANRLLQISCIYVEFNERSYNIYVLLYIL